VSGVCLSIYYACSCFVYFWCAGSVRISLAGRVIYFLCGTPLRGVPGRYNLFECCPGVDGGTVQVFFFSGSVVVGAVRLKWWGVVWLSFHFLYFAVSSPGGRLSVVRLCVP
jgi:hypothetical protein